MALKSVLGKGIGAILEDVEQAYNNDLVDEDNIQDLKLSSIELNPYQPRQHFDEEALKEPSKLNSLTSTDFNNIQIKGLALWKRGVPIEKKSHGQLCCIWSMPN